MLFLQHASDPIVWWSEDLLFNRPDWLREPPGRDRTRVDAVVSDRHVLAGRRRHDQCGLGPRRAWPQLRRLRARRLGGRRPARWLDAPRTPNASGSRWRRRDAERRARILVRASRFGAVALAAGLVGWSAGRPAASRRAYEPRSTRSSAAVLVAVGSRPARPAATAVVVWSAVRARGRRASGAGVAVATAAPRVRSAMAQRDLPAAAARWLGCTSPSAPCGRRRRRSVRRWARSRPTRSGRRWAGCCSRRRSGCHTSPTPEAQASRSSAQCFVTGVAGWCFALLAERSASLAAPMLAHLATNEAGAIAAVALQRRKVGVDGALADLSAPEVIGGQRRRQLEMVVRREAVTGVHHQIGNGYGYLVTFCRAAGPGLGAAVRVHARHVVGVDERISLPRPRRRTTSAQEPLSPPSTFARPQVQPRRSCGWCRRSSPR